MKDIVHRLREPMNVLQYDDITEEAAEEIERLRVELKEAKARNTLYLSRLQEHEAREQ